ncbi:MAG: cobalt transporter [Alphaproteobacteria bacterium]|nr:cobalt transporter [Alphaproteobacteria bacterium]
MSKTSIAATRIALFAHLPQALAAAVLGLFIVLGVGFVPVEAVHNAAHDTRHGFAFPCH